MALRLLMISENFSQMRIFLIVLLVIWGLPSITSGGDLAGYIRDAQTLQPLPGVAVIIDQAKIGTATNADGYFRFDDFPQRVDGTSLKIHLIGYKDTILKVVSSPGRPLEILLEQLPWKLDNIVVTATRRKYMLKDVPVTTELITADDFRKTGALTVDNALDSHIGVDISDDLSGRGISLRGIDPSRVLVLVDGNRVIGRVRGSLDLGQLPLNNVKQIEIVKGTGSTLYGSEAMGGVVNIITKEPLRAAGLDFYGQAGSFNSLDLVAGIKTGAVGKGMAVNTKYERSDGFDLDKSTEHTDGLEKINRLNIEDKIAITPNPGWNLALNASFMAEKKQWIESLLSQGSSGQDTFYNFDDYEHNYRYDLAANMHWKIEDNAEFVTNGHYSYYDHKWEKFTRTDYLSDLSQSVDDIAELSFSYNRKLAPRHAFTFGGDGVSERLKSAQLAVGDKRLYHGDFYAQYELKPTNHFTILPGIRWENHQTYGNHLNPGLNIMWNPIELVTLRGSISRGFRAPSIKELYFEFDHSAAGYIVFGGGDTLNPEKSLNYSVTAELNYKRKAMHRISYFRNDLKDLIDFDQGDFSDPNYPLGIYHYVNILKARTEGLEWETEIKMIEKWDLSFSYTYLIPKNLTEHIDLVNRPRHTLKFNTSYQFSRWDASANLWGNWHNRKLWNRREDTPDRLSDDYALARFVFNAGVSKKLWQKIGLAARVENIADNTNARYNYWPPRKFTVGITYSFERSK